MAGEEISQSQFIVQAVTEETRVAIETMSRTRIDKKMQESR